MQPVVYNPRERTEFMAGIAYEVKNLFPIKVLKKEVF